MRRFDIRYVAGVDGGGSGCRVLLATVHGAPLAEARGGPANVTTDRAGAIRNVRAALDAAAAQAELAAGWAAGTVAHLGLAGVLDPEDAKRVAAAMSFAATRVTDDRETSLAGALGVDDGVLAAVGTGTFVAARRAGAVRCFGGWGPQVGDQASGAWLGRCALRRTLQARDGLLPHAPLTLALLDRFDDAPTGIVRFAAQAGPADYAQLAGAVVEAADAKDAHAVLLMRRGAAYLEACISAAGLDEDDMLCLTGGLGPAYAPFLRPRTRRRLRPPRGTALDGALQLARQAAEPLRKGG